MPKPIPRCQIIPETDHQASFTVDGVERLRWHFGSGYPRPFFYPLIGPSGAALTRMGHPGAPDHDHHRSIWFAHEKVLGVNFWGDNTTARIRQKQWLAYQDGDEEAVMAVLLGWYDGHDPQELLTQELIVAVRPYGDGETLVELQSSFRPQAESLELGRTNFGFLAVRVAKGISAFFGGGGLRNSEGAVGEREIFGKRARWTDYSGPTKNDVVEGITYFDHANNPGHPTHWHVREDGWMGASFNLASPYVIRRDQPLVLRYLLHAHAKTIDPKMADDIADDFNERPGLQLKRHEGPHLQYDVTRSG
jgi:hypothetical protein